MAALNERPPLGADAQIWMGSYAFTATPGKGGEAVRSLLLREECQVPARLTLLALVVERLTDGTAVLLLLVINFPQLNGAGLPLALPLSLAVAGSIALWLMGRHGRAKRWLRSLPGGWMIPRRLLDPRILVPATLIGAVAWSLEGISLWLLLRAMGDSTISWPGATLAHTAAGLFGALTLLPGGLGSTEASTVGLLSLQGVALAMAVPGTLLLRLMTLWFATALGVLCLLIPRRRPSPATLSR